MSAPDGFPRRLVGKVGSDDASYITGTSLVIDGGFVHSEHDIMLATARAKSGLTHCMDPSNRHRVRSSTSSRTLPAATWSGAREIAARGRRHRREEPNGKLPVTLGPETEAFVPPHGKDVDVQQLVDLRRMLRNAGFEP